MQPDPVSLTELYSAFWSRNQGLLIAAVYADQGRLISLWIVALAGLSEAIGQSVLLFVHRVKPIRFVLSLLLSMVLFVVNFSVWVTTMWIVARYGLELNVSRSTLVVVTAISYIPLLLGFLAFLPYLGYLISQLLHTISLVALVRLLVLVLSISWMQALLCAIFGFLLVLITRTTIGRPIVWIGDRLRNLVAGTALEKDLDQILSDTLTSSKNRA